MKYISTRGEASQRDFEDVLLTGLADDGGLYVPSVWPSFSEKDIRALAGRPYVDVACRVMAPFVAGSLKEDELADMVSRAYGGFTHPAVTPLRQLDARHWLLELFHGPTLAFKDVAMQLLGPLFDHALTRRGARVTIVGATSGDTGSAAIEAMRGRSAVDIFILHPHGRTSEVQRRQMTTVADENVHNLAIEGTFDDCQALLKAMFNDAAFRAAVHMAGVNSINWARVMAQVVYYFYAGVALGAPDRPVVFSVPTGNFGDILAGYVAGRMGLPIERLVIATNVNDILVRALTTGRYETSKVIPTTSPSMDIQVSSNFERLLFDAYDRQPGAIRTLMSRLHQSGAFDIAPAALAWIRERFDAVRVDEAAMAETLSRVHAETGQLVDPHSAIGIAAAREHARRHPSSSAPMISLATAHPAKFPEAVARITGQQAELPPHLADLMTREERFSVLPNDLAKVQAYIREHTGAAA